MNQTAFGERSENYKPVCSDVTSTAERELGSFFTAVKQLYGPEQAEIAASDWLQELQAMSDFAGATPNWRQLTINAAKRLALRVNH
jgi:hypothetical protein